MFSGYIKSYEVLRLLPNIDDILNCLKLVTFENEKRIILFNKYRLGKKCSEEPTYVENNIQEHCKIILSLKQK